MLDTVENACSSADDLEGGTHGVRRGVCSAGHHPVNHAVVHQHGPEIRHVVDDLPGLLDGDPLLGAQLRVLLGELVAQLAGAGIKHRGRVQVDAEFSSASTDLAFIAEDGQVGDITLQQPAGGLEDSVVVTLGQHDALAIRSGPLAQLVGEHLWRGHLRDRDC